MAGGRTRTRLSLDTGTPILPGAPSLVERAIAPGAPDPPTAAGPPDGGRTRLRRPDPPTVGGPGRAAQSSGVIAPNPVPSRIGDAQPAPSQRYW